MSQPGSPSRKITSSAANRRLTSRSRSWLRSNLTFTTYGPSQRTTPRRVSTSTPPPRGNGTFTVP